MYLIKDRRLGLDHYVFTHADPRSDGFNGEVIENVSLDYDMNAIHRWDNGDSRPDPQLGRDPNDVKQFKVFRTSDDLRAAAFEFVHSGAPLVASSWSEYRKRFSPSPEEYAAAMTSDEWFDFLEETDRAARIRRGLREPDQPRPGSSRDQVAEWVAQRHMGSDGGIQEIWFLPRESPANEIRLLEFNDRYAGDRSPIEPLAFGLDVEGANYQLLVADVSTDQLPTITTNPKQLLPGDWRIEGVLKWGRRGRKS